MNNSATESNKTESSSKSKKGELFSSQAISWIVALGIVLFIAIFFKETVFQGKPISNVYAISRIDPFYNPDSKEAIKFCPIDPVIYGYLPAYVFNEREIRSFDFPLWNPISGTGYPHFAGIENAVLHPLRLLTSCETEYGYNFTIVLKVALAALSMFGLARCLGLSRWAGIFASIIYPLCPFILREIEICFESWCYPLVIWLFISMMRRSTTWSATAIGAGSALTVASLHPTSSIFILGSAAVLGFLSQLAGSEKESRLEVLLKTTKHFLLSVFIGFCFAAPVVFPFIELASNSWNYKNIYSNSGVPWQGLGLMLTNPTVGGASLYLGIIPPLLVPLAIFFPNKRIIPFTIFGVITFLLFTTITPLNEIFNVKPFTYLRPKYFLPIYLLLLTVMAAYGFDCVRKRDFLSSKSKWAVLTATVLLVLGTPMIFKQFNIPFTDFRWDGGMPCFDISTNAWRRDIVCTFIFLSTLFVSHRYLKEKVKWILPASCLTLAAISILSVSRLTLPPQPSFYFPPVEPIEWLQKQGDRTMGLGSTNFMHGIDNFYYHASFYLSRYVEFLKACGAERSYASYTFKNITPVLDAASVKYYLSQKPVICSDEKLNPDFKSELKIDEVTPAKGVNLSQYVLTYDKACAQILGKLSLKVTPGSLNSYGIQYALFDDSSKEIWTSEEIPLSYFEKDGEFITGDANFIVPQSTPDGSSFQAAFRITDIHSMTPQKPLKCSLERIGDNIVLNGYKKIEASADIPAAGRHYKFLFETPSQWRVYENTKALPRAYIVHNTIKAPNSDAAFAMLSKPDFNPRLSVILERQKPDTTTIANEAIGSGALETVAELNRPNNNSVSVEYDAKSDGILVLTDAFYPGWKAFLDGNETELYIANGLFRGVKVPSGKHTVEFRFVPTPVYAGLILTVLCSLGLLIKFAVDIRKGKVGLVKSRE